MTAGETNRASGKRSADLKVISGRDLRQDRAPIADAREERLFRSLDLDNDQRVLPSDLESILADMGLSRNDPRLTESMAALDAYRAAHEQPREEPPEPGIPRDSFCTAIRHNILLIERALQGDMVIPDFAEFCDRIDRMFAESLGNRDGKAADYIPQLDLKEPELDRFGLSLCTIDGQRHSVGDHDIFFPVESACKPVNYCLALEEHGEDVVHGFIGHEPSGATFNELTLNRHKRPHNPMINAGAIMSSALIKLKERREKCRDGALNPLEARGWSGARFDYVVERWQALCGGEKPRFSTPVYLSELETADRNFALAYHMREQGAFPPDVDLHDVLEFYIQCCSIEMTTEMLATAAATLANGGICPVNGVRVFNTETVQNCLSLMSSCGMYDYSGEFAFSIGLPAKSGVSGVIMIVIPNVMGLCTWSPRLDAHGNSVRGIDFSKRLVAELNFHNYDNLTGRSKKHDPRVSRVRMQAIHVNELIWAASKGDLGAMRDQLLRGAELACADYDRRTPLHLAAAEGQAHIVAFYIDRKSQGDDTIDLNPRDRWGGTPLDDAYRHGNSEVAALLERNGGHRGDVTDTEGTSDSLGLAAPQAESHKTAELIWAASAGDLKAIRRLVAQGTALDIADYDARTPLHLAAAEGHFDTVRYLLLQGVPPVPRDRWGNTPMQDAERHGHAEIAALLTRYTGRRKSRRRH
ncbi:MAG: glutaminase A [Minwuiales bacterium]|nr:glutaminase A [Minwuiales bacterium]